MKKSLSLGAALSVVLLIGAAVQQLAAQTVTSAPQVAGCPSPTPNPTTNVGWPTSSCKYQFYPLTDTTHAMASVSKTNPQYLHTYPGYGASAALIVCPKGATLSLDLKQCTDATGKDASVVVPKSSLSSGMVLTAITTAASPNTATLTWTAPTANNDGSPLTNLASYRIYQGTSQTNLAQVATVQVGTTTYVTPSLPPATYYFAVTAVNSAGTEGGKSGIVSKVITAPVPAQTVTFPAQSATVNGQPVQLQITLTITNSPSQ